MTPDQALIALVTHAKKLGVFTGVLDREPGSSPAKSGVTLALWAGPVTPVTGGLNATSARMEFTARCYRSMLAEPQGDGAILAAASAFVGSLTADFDLGLSLRMVDLLGAYGEPLGYDPGYVILDDRLFRIVDIRVPLIVNDVWTQAT